MIVNLDKFIVSRDYFKSGKGSILNFDDATLNAEVPGFLYGSSFTRIVYTPHSQRLQLIRANEQCWWYEIVDDNPSEPVVLEELKIEFIPGMSSKLPKVTHPVNLDKVMKAKTVTYEQWEAIKEKYGDVKEAEKILMAIHKKIDSHELQKAAVDGKSGDSNSQENKVETPSGGLASQEPTRKSVSGGTPRSSSLS